MVYKVAGVVVCRHLVPDEREGKDAHKTFGWHQQVLVFVGRMDTRAALGCSVSLCCPSHICWREGGTPCHPLSEKWSRLSQLMTFPGSPWVIPTLPSSPRPVSDLSIGSVSSV